MGDLLGLGWPETHWLECPLCKNSVLLPRQSPLGRYEGPRYQPTDIWPIDFVCFLNGQVCQAHPASIHPKTGGVSNLDRGAAVLWETVFACAHEDCGRLRTLYSRQSADSTPEAAIQTVLAANPSLTCEGRHRFGIAAETAEARMLR
jgi:hypothetical protein